MGPFDYGIREGFGKGQAKFLKGGPLTPDKMWPIFVRSVAIPLLDGSPELILALNDVRTSLIASTSSGFSKTMQIAKGRIREALAKNHFSLNGLSWPS